jgi:IclR family transcriptional regulator, KDG regulon repressor
MAKTQYVIQSVEAALDVLEALSGARNQRVAEICGQTGHSKNRVFRILATLEKRGYVQQDTETFTYSLGIQCLFLGDAAGGFLDIRAASMPILDRLAKETGDSAMVYVLSGSRAVCLACTTGKYQVQCGAHVGEALPLYVGAAPKVLAAHLPDNRRKSALAELALTPFTEWTVTNHDALAADLARIRSRGYCESENDLEVGIYAVAAPVYNHRKGVVAALSIAFPQTRDDPERRDRALNLVRTAARQLSGVLGHQ